MSMETSVSTSKKTVMQKTHPLTGCGYSEFLFQNVCFEKNPEFCLWRGRFAQNADSLVYLRPPGFPSECVNRSMSDK